MINWKKNLDSLKQMHLQIIDEIKGQNISYIDIPFHYNTGDLLIYLGTESFFEEANLIVKYRAIQNVVEHKKLKESDTILVHGGGNFGDIYLEHHRKREKLLLKYKDKKIIFLPQSIYFNSDSEFLKTQSFFSQLEDVTLYVRDHESYELGKKLTNNTILMPDMAHSLHPLIEESEITKVEHEKVLNLVRKDHEKVSDVKRLEKRSFDWSDIVSSTDKLAQVLYRKCSKIQPLKPVITKLWLQQANYNVTMALNYVEKYDHVHTDRLHGFILAYLLGKKVKLYDNSYAKVARYRNTWISECELISNGNK